MYTKDYIDTRINELTNHLEYVHKFLRYDDRIILDFFIQMTNEYLIEPTTRLRSAKKILHRIIRHMILSSPFYIRYKAVLKQKYEQLCKQRFNDIGYDDSPCFEVFYFKELYPNYSDYKHLFCFTDKL